MLKKYGYLWVTGVLFLSSLIAQWLTHSGPTSDFFNAVFENWQSEFLQLVWQVGGLMFLYAWGSQQSREQKEKQDAQLTDIIRQLTDLRVTVNSLGAKIRMSRASSGWSTKR